MVLVVGLLIAPSARHRIVEQGEATASINRFITRISLITLAPFALALGLDLGIAGTRIGGPWIGAIAGTALGLAADIHVVTSKITESDPLANLFTAVAAAMLFGLWHFWPWWRRAHRINASSPG